MSHLPPDRSGDRGRRPPRRASRREPLRPADPVNPGRTDTSPAGRILLVMVGALALAAVLNSQALLDDARGKPLGTSRTVSVAIWSPVARVSAFFGLDRPRNTAEAALGRGDDGPTVTVTIPPAAQPVTAPADGGEGDADEADRDATEGEAADGATDDQTGAGGDGTGGPGEEPAGPPPLPPASAEDPLQVLLVGDSTMTQVGGGLRRQLTDTGVADVEVDARPATGFSRPDFFDWPSRLAQLVEGDPADLVIAMFGANDAQSFEHDGEVHTFGSESWVRIYRARVATAMDLLVSRGGPVVWIGQPVMRSGDFDAKVRLIDDIFREEAARRPAIRYVDARAALAGPDGGYAEYRTDPGGGRTRIRDGDGIHMTTAGADLLAATVVEPIVAELQDGSGT